jgi:phage terminase large subunit-like protein
MFETYDVAWLYCDPWQWQSELEDWDARWPGKVVEYPTNSVKRMAAGVDRFRTALREGELHHDGDVDLRRHVLNARLRAVGRYDDGRERYVLEKAGPGRLIDTAVASVLAFEASAQIPPPKAAPLFAWART